MVSLKMKFIVIALVMALAPLVAAQPPAGLSRPNSGAKESKAPAKSKLEALLESALAGNPDLSVATAKAAAAEAELSRTRLLVTRQVVAAHAAVEVAEAELEIARASRTRAGESVAERLKSEQALVQARGKLAMAQAELDYLTGKAPPKRTVAVEWLGYAAAAGADQGSAFARLLASRYNARKDALKYAVDLPTTPSAENLRKLLDRKFTGNFKDVTARDVLAVLMKSTPGLHIQARTVATKWGEKVTAELKDMTLGAALQLLEDVTGERAVVRDYGLLFVPEEKVPPGAVTMTELWKKPPPTDQKPAGTKKP